MRVIGAFSFYDPRTQAKPDRKQPLRRAKTPKGEANPFGEIHPNRTCGPLPRMIEIPSRSFLIATPCDDGHRLCYWESLRAFERAYYSGQIPTSHRFEVVTTQGDSLIPRGRNNIAYAFLKSNHDFLFSIDSDLDFRPEDVIRLADLAAIHNTDILAGLYAIKQDELRWCINSFRGQELKMDGSLQEIAMAPGGLNITHRRVFESMIKAAPTWDKWRVDYTEDATLRDGWDFYFNGVVFDLEAFPDKPRGRYLSEDWGFSYFARKLGFRIWCDPQSIFLHCGNFLYPKQVRRLSLEEVQKNQIQQDDGTTVPIEPKMKGVKV
jgi:hypothetical protein